MEFETVKVWDAPMGMGKTTKAISMMNQNYTQKYIYITPLLNEVERIIEMCPRLDFQQPKPSYKYLTKKAHFLDLIEKGMNIVSTHSLFLSSGYEMMNLLYNSGYVLILDEVVSVLHKYKIYSEKERQKLGIEQLENLSKQDIDGLLELGAMSVDDDHKLRWVEGAPVLGKYHDVRNDARQGFLYYMNQSALMWSFPIGIFKKGIFKEINILTYQFDSQMMGAYFRYFDVPTERYSIRDGLANDYVLVPFEYGIGDDKFRAKIKPLIEIVQSKGMNDMGSPTSRGKGMSKLSFSWWENPSEDSLAETVRCINNFYNNIARCPDEERMWASFKDEKYQLDATGATGDNWVSFNSRATNDYRHKTSLVYLVNRYFSPSIKTFFSTKNVNLNEDEWALSELLQWIFRSAVRDGKKIKIYIPSYRMRKLLEAYLDNAPLDKIYRDKDLSRRTSTQSKGTL